MLQQPLHRRLLLRQRQHLCDSVRFHVSWETAASSVLGDADNGHADAGYNDDNDGDGVCWLLACLTSQQHANVSQGRICSDNCWCCHAEIEVAEPTLYFTVSQYADTGPTSPSSDTITPGAWHLECQVSSQWHDSTWKNSGASANQTSDLPLSSRTASLA